MRNSYNSLILCSIGDWESTFIDMVENAFLNQGFNTTVIGKNPYIQIDNEYILENIKKANVIVVIITNQNRIDLINEILEDNKSIFDIKKKPVMIFYDENFYTKLKDKGTYSVIINHSRIYDTLELQDKIEQFVSEFNKKVQDQQFLKDLGKVSLVLGGIGIGLGLLFSLFKEDD